MPDSHDLRRIRPIALILPLLVMALAVPSGTAATAATRVRGPFQLVPGVKLWRIRYPAPYQVRVLRIDPTLATMEQRSARRVEVDARVSAWTAARTLAELRDLL